MVNQTSVVIAGAGPAGLAAAITAAKNGRHVTVHERHSDVGYRFHGDFQGLENWTSTEDILEQMSAIGIEPEFEVAPFKELVCYNHMGQEHICQSSQPIFYLVRRGNAPGTLDSELKEQALAAGVEIIFNSSCRELPEGGIVAQGPHRADVIAIGYVFRTDMADAAFVALSDQLAPQGYAYLLVHKGLGTVASCMFTDFHNERIYLDRTVGFFQKKAGLAIHNERRFGGSGNFSIPPSAHKKNILHVGESAGFQDAFAGFGLRYAILSGHLAAESLLDNSPESYEVAWRKHFLGLMKSSVVNRYLYGMSGNSGYARFIIGIANSKDALVWIRRRYKYKFWKSIIYPFASRRFGKRLRGMCIEPGCNCTWCRCQHEVLK
ncbi:MAG: NAD(P)-binding protein [Gammaproteobacteria bacterium]|nr:NAD(P)-binding protein [Gammaproteobacteria bacterium]NIN62125.1 NAD(P)-binding protein [Gammaproteobacteria bacterium]NIO63619.1 NAD(P)-binding protein [Gammaproteobacteria bacterium]NIP48995.1 NAD(P)-binding protein [Gammaproteobacteria bacterium]NIQ09451.1 NAD(P)-binding protein [Gammaproteobacteria bacterium]